MSLLREWLLGVAAAALAVALALSLTPEGAVKKVLRLVGGLVLLLSALGPLGRLDWEALAVTAAGYGLVETGDAAQSVRDVQNQVIAEKTAAYIADKGAGLGAAVTAAVTVGPDENGWDVPWSVELTGTWTPAQQRKLAAALEEELNIPPERQSWREGEP